MGSDDKLFEAAMADVAPLEEGKARPKGGQRVSAVENPHLEGPTFEPAFQPSQPLPTDPVVILSNTAACLAGKIESLDGKTFRSLAQGEIKWTYRLDLHGFYEGDAWLAVMDFLHEAFRAGERCVLVITGKGRGYGPEGDMGIIKAQTAGWLAHHPRVAGFHTAVPKDGGMGAVYVFLRKNKVT